MGMTGPYTDTFPLSLCEEILDWLATVDLPLSLEALVELWKIDNCLQQSEELHRVTVYEVCWFWKLPWTTQPSSSSQLRSAGLTPWVPQEEPMELGWTGLFPEEKQSQQCEGLCLYCRGVWHLWAWCLVKGADLPVAGGIVVNLLSLQCSLTSVKLFVSPETSLALSPLIDSGADETFMDRNLCNQLKLQTLPKQRQPTLWMDIC